MLTSSSWTGPLLALVLITATPAVSATDRYTVQPGDSLSAIAARLLGDAGRWREIWSLNPQIRTPKQLQAGSQLRIPDRGMTLAADVTGSVDGQAAFDPTFDPTQILAQELIDSGRVDRMRNDYRLLDNTSAENRIRIHAARAEADGEYLYLHGLPANRYSSEIFGLFKPSREPVGTGFVELMRIGRGQLLLQQGDKARLRVIETRHPQTLKLPDLRVLPLDRPLTQARAEYPTQAVNARILKALYEQPGGYILLLDQGSRSGLKPGHVLGYTKPDVVQSPDSSRLPSASGGKMLVFDTGRDASLALVFQARQIPAVGDRVH